MVNPTPIVEELEGYVPGDQPEDRGTIKLNTNEFPYPPAPEVIRAIERCANDSIRLYPNPRCARLRHKLAEVHQVDPDNVFVGNGSDEILRLVIQAFGGPGRMTAALWPSYSLYEPLVRMTGAELKEFPLEGLEKIPASLLATAWDVLLLAVPNPPLGTLFGDEIVESLAEGGGLLLLDEAYLDFAEGGDYGAVMERHENVIRVRTFSKAYGLAGLRIGYALGHRSVLGPLNKIADSYNVNRISQEAAVAALEARPYYEAKITRMRRDRQWLSEELGARGFTVPASQANFIFARHGRARELYEGLKDRRIFVRYFEQRELADGVRISIGTTEELKALLDALDALL